MAPSPPDTSPREARKALSALEAFFAAPLSPADQGLGGMEQVRREADANLRLLLYDHRPFLEATGPGLSWPYRELARLEPLLAREARGAGESARQAALTLALLPFPGQWRRLAEIEGSPEPEVRAFLKAEEAEIADKVRGKGVSGFRMRHFCQILAHPGPDRRGILRVFSLPYIFLNQNLMAELARDYAFYLEPPMGLIFRHAWWRRFVTAETPVLFGLAGGEDREFLAGQGGHSTPLAHGSFLPPAPAPQEGPRDIDIVFNATFKEMERKRHGLMLDLMLTPELAGTTALFLGRGTKEQAARFRAMVAERGLGERVTAKANLPRAEVPGELARCRLGVHLSLYENSPRCVYEFLRAGLPLVVSTSMAGFDFSIITSQTGRASDDAGLARTIAGSLGDAKGFSPREWFLANTGSRINSARLAEEMAALIAKHGLNPPERLAPLGSSGPSRYLPAGDYAGDLPELSRLAEIFQRHLGNKVRVSTD